MVLVSKGGNELIALPLEEETFRIGQRNYTILRKFLWKNNILINKEDVGGSKARTLSLYMADGRTTVKSEGKEVDLC